MYTIIYWINNGKNIRPVLDESDNLKTFDHVEDADRAADEIPDSRVISISGVEE